MVESSPSADDVRLSHGFPLAHAVTTDTGRVRENNEDNHGTTWLPDGSLLVAVCDGMGGHEAGEVASRLAVDTIADVVLSSVAAPPQERIHEALKTANDRILAESRQGGKRGMGTTAVVALLRGAEVHVGLVGDSRLYHVRRGRVLERTVDHTRVQSLLSRGLITEDEARDHPDVGMLTRALGHAKMSNGKPLEPEVFADPLVLEEGDALVMSTDGLHDLVEDDEIAGLVAGLSAQRASRALVDLALERGGHDNVTVAVITAGTSAAPSDRPVPEDEAPGPVVPETVPLPTPVVAYGRERLLMILAFAGGLLLFAAATLLTIVGVLVVHAG